MTKEEIKEAAKVMEAYANGKKIQCNDNHLGNGEWVTTDNPSFNWDKYAYRIKPEPKYRPFKTQEECWNEMLKHQPFGWAKSKKSERHFSIGSVLWDSYIPNNSTPAEIEKAQKWQRMSYSEQPDYDDYFSV